MKTRLTILLVVIAFYSCVKPKHCNETNQVCNSSQLCVTNETRDTIFYGVNINMFTDTLLPGKTFCIAGDRIDVEYDKKHCQKNRKSWYAITINSSVGEWAINAEHCAEKASFRYDSSGSPVILLYDTSE